MADFDPIAAGGIPYNPGAPAGGMAQPTTEGGAPVAAGMPPGFEATTGAAAEQQKAMTTRAQNYANDMYPLLKAQQELAIAPTGPMSPGSYDVSAALRASAPETVQRVLHFLTTYGGLTGPGIMSPEQTDAYGLVKKLLTQGQLGVPGAARSNEGGATAQAAFPNVEMPPPAAKAALQGIIGLRRMEQDQTMQWQQKLLSGAPVQSLPTFISDFQTKADPRVYIWDQTPKAQQDKILTGMSPAQRRTFITQVQRADSNGIYNTFGMSPQ